MIAPDGFVVLRDFAGDVRHRLTELLDPQGKREQRDLHPTMSSVLLTELALSSAFTDIQDIWLYSPSGQLHNVSRDVLHTLYGRDKGSRSANIFAFFSIDDFKIDLGRMANASLEMDDPNKSDTFFRQKFVCRISEYDLELATVFAAFEGYFLVMREGDLPGIDDIEVIQIFDPRLEQSHADIDGKLSSVEEHSSPSREQQIEDRLREIVGRGELPKRDDFRMQFAPDLKVEAFRSIWRQVANEYPEMSKSGPKPKRNP